MQIDEILKTIDQQITQLQQARALLTNGTEAEQVGKRRGRPKGSVNKAGPTAAPVAKKASGRTMSAEGKARIATAQKRRWAAKRKADTPAKSTAKKASTKASKKGIAPIKKAATENDAGTGEV